MAQGLTTDDVARVLGITRRAVLDLLAEHLAEVPAKYRRPDL
jgi:DNA-binding transcriptional regulator LsrR (DeoR family)